MISRPVLVLFALALCALAPLSSRAQEPAYLYGMQAMRYVEGPDFYHYVYLCKRAPQPPVGGAQPVPPVEQSGERSICWTVRAVPLRMVAGKIEPSQPIDGVLAVSRSEVAFVPSNAKASEGFTAKLPWDTPVYQYYPAKKAASLIVGNVGYSLALTNMCNTCASGAAPPSLTPEKNVQLDHEYEEVGDSLKHFDTVADRIAAMTANVRVAIAPRNQPSPNQRPAMMALFAQLNRKVSPVCPDPARSCVDSYAKYQQCKSSPDAGDCGSLPVCTAVCPMTWTQIQKDIHASFCTSRFSDSAALFPDWTPLFAEDDARRKANLARLSAPSANPTKQIQMSKEESPPTPLSTTPGIAAPPFDPRPSAQNACTPDSAYSTAELMHMSAPVVAGVPGMAGMTGPANRSLAAAPQILRPGVVALQGYAVAGSILQKTVPVYPPLARAAHVSGAVVLHALISKTGDIENLEIVSGPPMLQSAALDAVKQWKYKPFLLNSEPTAVDTTITVNFNFGEAPPANPAATPAATPIATPPVN